MLYPTNIEHKIGFDTIRQLITAGCVSRLGAEIVERLTFTADFDAIVSSLTLVDEMMTLQTESDNELPLGSIADMRAAMARTAADGTFLDVQDVVDLRLNVITLRLVTSYLRHSDEERFPALLALAANVELFPDIERQIDSLIDRYGNVRDNASDALAVIRRQIHETQSSISKTLNAILRQAQTSGAVDKEASPTLREGRLVIPVAAVNKRQIPGIVHDESATGKTVYIEPTAVVAINNRLRELENEERREIIRILVAFTDTIRPIYPALEESVAFLATVDSIAAKAKFSLSINAIKPYLTSQCEIDWHEARHPLLEMSLKAQGRKIEPLNIKLNNKQRILLISGPNAGGKSVCLKTVGLLQYMLQCGLPIPIHERSRAGLFASLFIDIGDEQSIENDLSTYSSHLLNMKNFIRHSCNRTLLLIDEFGTGTEPQLGGAIAEAVLDKLNGKGVYGVITTHYTNLKHYAARTEGVANAAMLYDRHRMQPLFMLSIGTAGSSFAIEIARKIGLPDDVITAASAMVGTEQVDFDKHLQDVARDKRYWENKRQQIKEKEHRLQQLTERYETLLDEMKTRQRDTLRQAKQQAADIIADANAQIERTVRTIRESEADKETTKQLRAELQEKHKQLTAQAQRHEKPKAQHQPQHTIANGDHVRISGQDIVGQVIDIQGKNATVAFGQLKTTVALAKLEWVSVQQAKNITKQQNKTSSATSEIRQRQLNFRQELDVRGMRVDEALQAVMYYVDDAQMVGVSQVRILHGTGTGALRGAIRDYLHQSPAVVSYRDEHVQFGGAGITIVEMA